ncbi:hypothetical protein BH11BAC3_BH11BAC3_14120 [soil metagenome]
MTNDENANSEAPRNEKEIKQSAYEAGKLMKEEEKSNPVKDALKKEISPTSADDLSAIHNTHEVGTSGGDQRAPDNQAVKNPSKLNDYDNDPGTPPKPAPVEEPEAAPGDSSIIYDDPGTDPEINTD